MEKKTVYLAGLKSFIPSEFEAYLEDMAKQGWEPKRISQGSSFFMTFEKTGSKKVKYAMDVDPAPAHKAQYLTQNGAWQSIGRISGYTVWKMEYTGKEPAYHYNDTGLRVRFRQIYSSFLICFVLFILIFLLGVARVLSELQTPPYAVDPGSVVIAAISFVLLIFLGVNTIKIKRTKKKPE